MFTQNLIQRKKCLVCLPETTEFAIASCKLYYSKITIYILLLCIMLTAKCMFSLKRQCRMKYCLKNLGLRQNYKIYIASH